MSLSVSLDSNMYLHIDKPQKLVHIGYLFKLRIDTILGHLNMKRLLYGMPNPAALKQCIRQ